MSRSTKIQKSQFHHSELFNSRMKKRAEVSKEIKNLVREKSDLIAKNDLEEKGKSGLSVDQIDAKLINLTFYLRKTSLRSKAKRIKVCAKTGRSRGCFRKIGMSRHVLRKYGAEGMLMGLKKV